MAPANRQTAVPARGTRRRLRLRPPRHRVAHRAVVWWTLRALGLVILIVGPPTAAFAIAIRFFPAAAAWGVPLLTSAAALGLLYVLVVPWWRYAVHRWETSDEAVYSLTGWFIRRWRIAPISRIQSVDTVRGPVQQLLGLSTIVVTTASSYGAILIVGLEEQTAEETTRRLTELTQAVPGDAT